MGYPSFYSEIQGVSVFVLSTYDDNFPREGIEGNGNEFIEYCNGKNKIYVLNIPDESFVCEAKEAGGNYEIFINSKDKRLEGKKIISKHKIARYSSSRKYPDISELKSIRGILDKRKKHLDKQNFDSINSYIQNLNENEYQEEYSRNVDYLSKNTLYKDRHGYTVKINANNVNIIISEVGVDINALGWNFRYAVIKKTDNGYEFIGEIVGCIDDMQDLDRDGIPEISTSSCENDEGYSNEYWRIYPEVKVVVGRSQ